MFERLVEEVIEENIVWDTVKRQLSKNAILRWFIEEESRPHVKQLFKEFIMLVMMPTSQYIMGKRINDFLDQHPEIKTPIDQSVDRAIADLTHVITTYGPEVVNWIKHLLN